MTNKRWGIIGLFIPILFWSTYFLMSASRPEYSMFTKAISELGSVDAPNKWIWNLFGYIISGVLIAIYSIGLYKSVAVRGKQSKLPLYALLFSGVFMAISGVFPGDFDQRESTTMLLHTVGSFGSYVFFLIAAFTYLKLMNANPYWKTSKTVTALFTYLTIVFGAWPFIFAKIPAFGQRAVFFFYFLWIFFTAYKVFYHKVQAETKSTNSI